MSLQDAPHNPRCSIFGRLWRDIVVVLRYFQGSKKYGRGGEEEEMESVFGYLSGEIVVDEVKCSES